TGSAAARKPSGREEQRVCGDVLEGRAIGWWCYQAEHPHGGDNRQTSTLNKAPIVRALSSPRYRAYQHGGSAQVTGVMCCPPRCCLWPHQSGDASPASARPVMSLHERGRRG